MKKVLIDTNIVFDISNGFKSSGVESFDKNSSKVAERNLKVKLNAKLNAVIQEIDKVFKMPNEEFFNTINESDNYKKVNDALVKLAYTKNLPIEQKMKVVSFLEKNFNNYKNRLSKIIEKEDVAFKNYKKKPTKEKIDECVEDSLIYKANIDDRKSILSKITDDFYNLSSEFNAVKMYRMSLENKFELVIQDIAEKELLCHIVGSKEYVEGLKNAKKQLKEKLKKEAKEKGVKFDNKSFLKAKKWYLSDKEKLNRNDIASILSNCSLLKIEGEIASFIIEKSAKLQEMANMSKYKNRMGQYGDAILVLTSYISGYDFVTNNTKDFMSTKKGLQYNKELLKWVDAVLDEKTIDKDKGIQFYEELEKDQEPKAVTTSKKLKQKDTPKHIRIENMIFEEYNKFLRAQGKKEISLDNFRHGIVYGVADFVDTYDKVYKKPELFDSKVVETKDAKTDFAYKKQEVLVFKKEDGISK